MYSYGVSVYNNVRALFYKESAELVAFQIRVLADGGVIEAKQCLNETIKNLKSL